MSTHIATATTTIALARMIARRVAAAANIMAIMLTMIGFVFDKTFAHVPIAAGIHLARRAGQHKCDLPEQEGQQENAAQKAAEEPFHSDYIECKRCIPKI